MKPRLLKETAIQRDDERSQNVGRFFDRLGRRVHLACELPVYYPAERMVAPDVMAVLAVSTHWVVTNEGKGIGFALDVFVADSRRKDYELNVERYARLGIPEYFIFDRRRLRLSGRRLKAPGAGAHQPIVPQAGRHPSAVLGLDLVLRGERLRFFLGDAEVPEAEELIGKLEGMLNQLDLPVSSAEQRALEETRLRLEEAERRVAAEERLARALAELERLKRRE